MPLLLVSPAAADPTATSDSGVGQGIIEFGTHWYEACDADGTGYYLDGPGFSSETEEQDRVFQFMGPNVLALGGNGVMYLCGNVRGSCAGGIEGYDGMGRLEVPGRSGVHALTYNLTGLAWDKLPGAGMDGSLLHITGRYEAFQGDWSVGAGTVVIDMAIKIYESLCTETHTWNYSMPYHAIQFVAD